MKVNAVLSACFVGIAASALAGDAVWQGGDGAALNDASNWNGNPFYDATTNATTDARFDASASTTLTGDMSVYRFKLNAENEEMVFDLGSHVLACANGLFAFNSKKNADITFKNGVLSGATSDGSVGSAVCFDNVCYTGDISMANSTAVVLTNGTKMAGGIKGPDGVTSSRILVAGSGTKVDFGTKTLQFIGRSHTGPATSNEFVIADGAVVTNFGGTAYGGFAQNVCGLWGKDNLIEVRDNAVLWMNESGDFRQGLDGKSLGIGGNRLRILSGAKAKIHNLSVGNSNSCSNLLEVAGENTELTLSGSQNTVVGGKGCRDNRVWVHDHATMSVGGGVSIGSNATVWNSSFVIEDGATVNLTGDSRMDVGYNADNYRCSLRVDSGSTLNCYRLFAGVADTPRTNSVWIGDSAKIETRGYVKIESGSETTLVVSNGTLVVGDSKDFNLYSGNTLVLAGSHPSITAAVVTVSGKLVFQIPKTGFDVGHAPIVATGSGDFNMNNPTPSFDMKDFVRSPGGTVTLAEVTGTGKIAGFDAAKAKWEAALEEACDGRAKYALTLSSDKKKLILTIKPRRGLAVIIR